MKRAALLALLAAACGAAWADPFTAVGAISAWASAAAGAGTFLGLSAATWVWIGVAATALGAVNQRRKARQASARARADYNASLQDRTVSVLRTDPPWQVVYGRAIVGGAIFDIVTTDKANAKRENGADYTKPDAYKTLVVQMASHEVQAIHEIFVDGVPVGPTDASGWAAMGSSAAVTFTHATGMVNWAATPATNGLAVVFTGGTAPAGLTGGQIYFVRDQVADGFKLASTPGGPAISFTTDGSGTITGQLQSPFYATTEDSRTTTFTNSVTITEPLTRVFYATSGTGASQIEVVVTIVGDQLVSAVPDIEVTCTYGVTKEVPTVRVSRMLGADTQTTDAVLAEIAPARYTSSHRLRNIAGVVVTLDLEDKRFQGGPPNITGDVSGRKVYDPRTATTAWSDNPALCVRDWLLSPWGYEVAADDMDEASVQAAANACDVAIDLTVGTVTQTGQPRYTCNGAFVTDGNREGVLDELVDSMAGVVSYGAKWRVMAGAWSASVMSLTDDDLHGQIEVVQADTPMSELFNGVRGQLYLAGAQSTSEFNPYANSVFVADDGRELWANLNLPFTNHLARARNLCRVMVERNRSGQVIRYPAKLKAWPLQIGDRVTVTSAEYGITSKLYRVTDWDFDITGAVGLTLQEDAADIYDLADAAVADPTPNNDISDPWAVPPLAGLAAVSGTSTLLIQGDGTVLPRVLVSWTAITAGGVVGGGAVEVMWRAHDSLTWSAPVVVAGAETQAYLQDVVDGAVILIEARAQNARGRNGPSSFLVHTVGGKTTPPSDVTGLDWAIKPGQVVITCDPCPDADYDATELRVGASWASAAFLVRGASTEYHHPRPPNGTYTVLAKHRDTSGNYSTNAASISVTVDDSIDGGGGGFLVLEASGALFEFADGTTHTSTSLPITFTARLVGLAGTVTWTATAYDAMTGGTAIGAVTMTTNGNAATMTAAQFTAPGTLGSVRRVDVTATLGAQSDTLAVYRYDPTVSSALLWLSKRQAVVPTDEAGEYGDYEDASTYAAVYKGNGSVIQDLTSAHTWTITPDSGVTATINGGAGPVSGASSILIAVSAMTIDDGAVLVTATPGSGPALTATFRVVKSKASGTGWTAYWEPGSLTLPVRPDGSVATFDGATSDFAIVNAMNQLDDTPNWGKSITARNVTAELVGARVQITGWLPLGQVSAGGVIPSTRPASWTRAAWPIYTPSGNWLQPGYNNSAPWDMVRRATAYDAVPWTDIAVPSGWWTIGDASRDTIILGEVTGSSNRYIRSVDDGLTWIEETLPSGAQRASWIHTGAEWLVSSHGSTAGYRSVTGVAGTWSAVTMPGLGCQLAGGAGVVLATTSMGVQFYSVNGGVNWLPMADGYSGAAAFNGRLYTLLAGDTTKMLVWDGGRWVKQALPASAAGFSGLLVIRDVLYLIAAGNIMYTSDGLTWRAGGSGTSTLGAWVRSGSRALMVDFIPHTNTEHYASNWAVWKPLLSTSDTEASVTMRATKPDEADIRRVLPVYKGQAARVLYVASADPAILMLPATSDGVVTSYAGATVTGKITADGVDVTSLYSITWGTTNLTPASGSGAVVNITAMPQAATEGTIVWQAVRAGYPVVNGTTFVRKSLSTDPSGPKLGRAFTVTAVSATYVALKFGADGYWYTKVGSGGAWVVQDRWVVGASPSAFWLYIPTPPEGAFTSGTTDTWLSLASDRIYVLDDATPGTHTRTVVVGMNSSASDVGAGWGNGALRLIVP